MTRSEAYVQLTRVTSNNYHWFARLLIDNRRSFDQHELYRLTGMERKDFTIMATHLRKRYGFPVRVTSTRKGQTAGITRYEMEIE